MIATQEWRIYCAENRFPYCDTCLMPAVSNGFGDLRHTSAEYPSGIPSHLDDSDHEVSFVRWNNNTWVQPAIQELLQPRSVSVRRLCRGDEFRGSDGREVLFTVWSEKVRIVRGTENSAVPRVKASVLLPDLAPDERDWPSDQVVRIYRRLDQ